MNFTYRHLKIIVALILLIVSGLIIWQVTKQPRTQTATQTTTATKGSLIVSVSTSGTVNNNNTQAVVTNASGVVKKLYVENNTQIKSGAKIAEIELSEESKLAYNQALASYQSAKNSLASAKANLYTTQANMLSKWDTYKELSESEDYKDTNSDKRSLPEFVVPQNEWLAAEANYKIQQDAVNQAQLALNNSASSLKQISPIIIAPISGEIKNLSILENMVLTKETTIANIVTDALPTISVNLTEVDVTKVSEGDKVTITVDALADKTYTGKVLSINTSGEVSSGVTSYPATIILDTAATDILSNMAVQANIITDTKNEVILLPTNAVTTQNGQSSVKVIKDGQTSTVNVETGLASGTQIEIISGINEGDEVVINATRATTTSGSTTKTTSPFSSFGGGGNATFRMR
ncbi:efflux RND transporter periplasmic adaptor subunit [Patescibacteria group bacterium]|nr:efflux RND transporter periplasmic adaptor subunit [Patescibacteria group bacterium]